MPTVSSGTLSDDLLNLVLDYVVLINKTGDAIVEAELLKGGSSQRTEDAKECVGVLKASEKTYIRE